MSTASVQSENHPVILLVEDDVRLAGLVSEYLQQQRFRVDVCHRGDHAIRYIQEKPPALVILDIMLPIIGGLDVCKTVRPFYDGPILMLTARGDEIDQVVGLELGADDYVAKPAQPRLLLARIEALLRRVNRVPVEASVTEVMAGQSQLEFGPLVINRSKRAATIAGQDLGLTTIEFDLLWFLGQQAGNIASRDSIYSQLKGIEYDGIDRSVDISISRLRRKLMANDVDMVEIKSIRARGYLFAVYT